MTTRKVTIEWEESDRPKGNAAIVVVALIRASYLMMGLLSAKVEVDGREAWSWARHDEKPVANPAVPQWVRDL